MQTLTFHCPPRGLIRCSGVILALLTTMSLAGAELMDSPLTARFQEMLDARARSLNGAGMIMAVRMAGRGEWVGATGHAQRGHEALTDASG